MLLKSKHILGFTMPLTAPAALARGLVEEQRLSRAVTPRARVELAAVDKRYYAVREAGERL